MIREARQQEADLLAEFIRRAYRDVAERFNLTPQNCPIHPSNCSVEWIKSAMAKGIRFFIDMAEDGPRGCVALEQASPEVCYIERLCVLPAHRRQGLGKQLVERAIAEARTLGARQVELGLIADHVELRYWYSRLGFVATREHVPIVQVPLDVTFMARSLDGQEITWPSGNNADASPEKSLPPGHT